MDLSIQSCLTTKANKDAINTIAKVFITTKEALKSSKITLSEDLPQWQIQDLGSTTKKFLTGNSGPVWFLTIDEKEDTTHQSLIKPSDYALAKNLVGSTIKDIHSYSCAEVIFDFIGCPKEVQLGAIVGIELGLYRFKKCLSLGKVTFKNNGKALRAAVVEEASNIAVAINQARHLINLPPNELNPVSYAKGIEKLYAKSKAIKVKVLDEKELKKQKCGLLLSVGMSSNNPPRIVHLQYRPKGAKGKPIAVVGKGLTFDSGGLDIKSAAGMRFMKKDMGGSAAVIGFSRWLETSKAKKNVDLYVALAENAVSDRASRPSDIFTARNGMTVEIHNTDAEGRLAMADAIDLALDNEPSTIIDVATLTGAGKVALGQDITSLFSNDDKLAEKLQAAGQKYGDLNWRMPLYQPYFSGLKSDFADLVNAASGHGGAITAALFLQKFVKNTKWAHLDIYGWTTANQQACVQKGGNGQGVETLIGLIK
jgi:leucyl aminopeptidase